MAIRRDCAREMGKRLQEMEVKHRQRRREAEKAEQEKMDKKLDMANAMHEETVGELTQKIESLEVQLKTATEAAGDAAPLLQKIEELTKTVAQHAAALNAERELVIQLRQQLEEQAAKATMADQTREAGQDLSSPQLQSINDTTDMTINDKDVPASGPSNGDLVQDESSSDSLVKQPKRLSAIPIVSGNESLSKARRPSEPTRASSDRVQIAVESARKKRKSTSRIEPSPSLDSRGTSDSSTVNSPTGTKAARKRRTQSKSRTSLSSNSETSLLDNITEEQKHQSFSIEIVPKAIRRISSRKSLEPKLEASMVQDRTDDDPATSIVPDAENESLADINEGDAPIKKKRKLRTKKAVDMEEFDEPARSSGSGKRYSTIVSRLPRNE
ncbi:hypothetical protein DFS34DRAFT_81620 [Phlyctochytrium arcticum]|nr:hypothetical protein DFS34DRAFT_81620 [Phlyctochytrium arcticum]